jgi:D-alanine-D-alanine ligase
VAAVVAEKKIEVAFIALHGGWGEDGSIQGMMEIMEIPYTGSGVLASAVAMDKSATKLVFEQSGIKTPAYKVVAGGAKSIKGMKAPLIVKPASGGSTLGLTLVEKSKDLGDAVADAAEYGGKVLVEEFIEGRELTVSVLGGEVLPVIEIIPEGIYDYKAKYLKGATEYRVPAVLSKKTEKAVKSLAASAYDALGCRGAARVDLILDEGGGAWALEVNTVPGLTELSLFPKAAASVGIGYGALVEEMLLGATTKR